MLSQPVPASSSRLPGLPRLPGLRDRGFAYTVLALGLAGLLTELISPVYLPRLVLYLTVLAFGVVGVVGGRRAQRRENAEPFVTAAAGNGPVV